MPAGDASHARASSAIALGPEQRRVARQDDDDRGRPARRRAPAARDCTAWPVPRCSRLLRRPRPRRRRSGRRARPSPARAGGRGPRPRAARRPRARSPPPTRCSGRPATSWSTLARSLFMRVPRPAARMTTMGCDMRPGRYNIPAVRTSLAAACALVALALAPRLAGAHQSSATYARLEVTPGSGARALRDPPGGARPVRGARARHRPRGDRRRDRGGQGAPRRVPGRAGLVRGGRPAVRRSAGLARERRAEPALRPRGAGRDLSGRRSASSRWTTTSSSTSIRATSGSWRWTATTSRLTRPDDTRLVWQVGDAARRPACSASSHSGVEHILYGLDHILFLLSLLLMAVVTRDRARPVAGGGAAGSRGARLRGRHRHLVHRRALDHADRRRAGLVRAARPPGRERHRRLDPLRRGRQRRPRSIRRAATSSPSCSGWCTASASRRCCARSCRPRTSSCPLLAFNVGVELGQLGIVLVSLPLLYAIVRAIGAARYRRMLLPAAAVVLGSIAFVWLLERSLDVVILGLGG